MSQTACVWPQIERYYLRILPRNFSTRPCRLYSQVSSPPVSLLSFFSFFLFLWLSLPTFFSKHLFATLTTKLSTNEDVSTPVKLGTTSDLAVENVLLLLSISPAGKRWNHRQYSQTSGLIEQKKHYEKTEERSTFRAPLCNRVSAIFPSNIPYLETINYD